MPEPSHPLLPYLVDLESPYRDDAQRPYEPADLVRYAFGTTGHYWADLALGWVEQGVASGTDLTKDLAHFESDESKPQASRHRAKRLRKAL